MGATASTRSIEVVAVLRDQVTTPGKQVVEVLVKIEEAAKTTGKAVAGALGPIGVGFKILNGIIETVYSAISGTFKFLYNSVTAVAGSVLNLKTVLVGVAAGFIGGKIAGAFLETAEALDELGAVARKVKAPVGDLSELKIAAKLNNIEFGTLARTIGILNRNLAQLAGGQGSSQGKDAIAKLGITQERLKTMTSVVELLPDIADGLAGLASESERVAAAAALFGRGYQDALLILGEGSGKLRESIELVRKFKLTLTEAEVEAGDKLTDALDLLSAAFTKLKAGIIEVFGPVITRVLEDQVAAVSLLAGRLRAVAFAVREAVFGEDGPNKDEARKLLQNIGDVALRVLASVGRQVLSVVRTILVSVFSFISDFVTDVLIPRIIPNLSHKLLSTLFTSLSEGISSAAGPLATAIETALGVMVPGLDILVRGKVQPALEGIAGGLGLIGMAAGGLEEALPPVSTALGELADKTLNDQIAKLAEAFGELWQTVQNGGDDLATAADQAKDLAERLTVVAEKAKQIVPPPKDEMKEFFDAWRQGADEAVRATDAMAESGKAAGAVIGTSVTSGVAHSLREALSGVEDLGDAFADLGRNAVGDLLEIITRLLIIKLLSSTIGGTGWGGLFGFAVGNRRGGKPGMPGFVAGGPTGMVRGPSSPVDSIPIRVTGGEYIIRPEAVTKWGEGFLAAINAGVLPGPMRRYALGGAVGGSSPIPSLARLGSPVPAQDAPGAQQAVLVADKGTMSTLLSGGGDVLLRFIRENKAKLGLA